MTIRATTLSRIEGAHRFSASYRGALANHLPMALLALDAMGADDAALARFQASYQDSHLEPLAPATFEIAVGEEATYFGRAEAFPAWIAYYERRIRSEGVTDVLAAVLDPLMASVESGAFHGAIRAAYALESQSSREMAHALAYWSAAREAPIAPVVAKGNESPMEVLAAAGADPDIAGKRAVGPNIVSRTRAAMTGVAFRRHAERLDPAQLSLENLAHALLRAYGATGNFTVLHGVTGCHATRVLVRFASDPASALQRLWAGLLGAYIGEGAPALGGWALPGNDTLDWPAIHARAVRCNDEHDVKLAYTCWREWQDSGDDLYRRVASATVCHAFAAVEAC